jgi:hypothetical protein
MLMVNDAANRLAEKPLFVSDELAHYASALAEACHTTVDMPTAGKRGRPGKPEIVIDKDLDYAAVHKVRKDRKIVQIIKKLFLGMKNLLKID